MGEGLGRGGLLVLGLKGTGTPTEKAPPDCSAHMSDDPPHQGLVQVPSDCQQIAPPTPLPDRALGGDDATADALGWKVFK